MFFLNKFTRVGEVNLHSPSAFRVTYVIFKWKSLGDQLRFTWSMLTQFQKENIREPKLQPLTQKSLCFYVWKLFQLLCLCPIWDHKNVLILINFQPFNYCSIPSMVKLNSYLVGSEMKEWKNRKIINWQITFFALFGNRLL